MKNSKTLLLGAAAFFGAALTTPIFGSEPKPDTTTPAKTESKPADPEPVLSVTAHSRWSATPSNR